MKGFTTIVVATGALLVSGCMETMPHPERPRPPRPERPMACTREYAPVCAGKGWRKKTFGNACEARAANYSVIREGACEGNHTQ